MHDERGGTICRIARPGPGVLSAKARSGKAGREGANDLGKADA